MGRKPNEEVYLNWWIDNDIYGSLDEETRAKVNKYHNYQRWISHQEKKIEENIELLRKIKRDNKDRRKKIDNHRQRREELYMELLNIIPKHHIPLTYNETLNPKSVGNKTKYYTEIQLRYKLKNKNGTTPIYLKSSREKLLKELNEKYPSFFTSKKINKMIQEKDISKVGDEMIRFFQKTVNRIIGTQLKSNEKVKINYKLLLYEVNQDLN